MAVPTDHDPSRLRLTVILVVVCCLFVSLFARLWFLEVINAPSAQLTAQDQGVKTVYLPAPRGEILDATGQVLVGNRTSEIIEVTDRLQALTDTVMLARLGALVGMTLAQVKALINNTDVSPSYAPAVIVTDAPAQEILYIQEHQSLFPGVTATTETVPDYTPMGRAAANVVGYVGQITQQQYARLKSEGYQPGDQIGQAGIEADYESVLRGTPGIERVQVNSQGDPLGVLSEIPPVPGLDVELTINGAVQEEAVSAIEQGLAAARTTIDTTELGGKLHFPAPAGAAVVEDPQNGQIEALATVPDYDPDEFVGGISTARYRAYQAPSANQPLLDRAMQGVYAPGSTFKLVTATAGLEEGLVTPTSIYQDTGHVVVGGETFTNDAGEAYGPIDVSQALGVSSDNFFNVIGEKQWDGRAALGPDAEQNVAHGYGFGEPSGIKLPGESTGLIPTQAIQNREHRQDPAAYPYPAWTTGESMQTAIGQDQVLVTPLQLANAYSAFANGGTLWQPQLVSGAENAAGQVVRRYPPVKKGDSPPLTPAQRAAMLQGFLWAVNGQSVAGPYGGTAYTVFHSPEPNGTPDPLGNMDIAGKTGTSQATGKPSTSVFTSFAPATNPRYEVTCFMEEAGYGSSVAGPVVRQIYDQLYGLPLQPVIVDGQATND